VLVSVTDGRRYLLLPLSVGLRNDRVREGIADIVVVLFVYIWSCRFSRHGRR
jgi:hypothetical protein